MKIRVAIACPYCRAETSAELRGEHAEAGWCQGGRCIGHRSFVQAMQTCGMLADLRPEIFAALYRGAEA